jgi:cytochrome c oxidase subunit IV
MSEHVLPAKLYYTIWICLLILTGATVGVAHIDLGPYNTVMALAIATIKAVLVVLFFMHVKYTSEKMSKVVIVSAIFWLFILLALSLSDYATRGRL